MGYAHVFRLSPVDRVAEDPAAGGAVRVHGAAAVFAFAAGRDARDQDAVAGAEGSDAGPCLLDRAHTLVAENAPGSASRDIALEDMQVRATDSRLRDSDDRVGCCGDRRHRSLLELLLAWSQVDEGFHRSAPC